MLLTARWPSVMRAVILLHTHFALPPLITQRNNLFNAQTLRLPNKSIPISRGNFNRIVNSASLTAKAYFTHEARIYSRTLSFLHRRLQNTTASPEYSVNTCAAAKSPMVSPAKSARAPSRENEPTSAAIGSLGPAAVQPHLGERHRIQRNQAQPTERDERLASRGLPGSVLEGARGGGGR